MILWSGTLAGMPLRNRIKIAAAAGYSDLSVAPMDFGPPGSTEKRSIPLRQLADDFGVRLSCLDPVTAWLPDRASTEDSGRQIREEQQELAATFDAYTLNECLALAHSVGAHTISAVEIAGYTRSFDELVDGLSFIGETVASIGARAQLEPMPFSAIKTPSEADLIVRASGIQNAGIVVDTWHYSRMGGLAEHLRALPAGSVSSLQISDGPAIPFSDLWNESSGRRLPPGSGDFHLTDIIRESMSVCCHGALVGPEVLSTSFGKTSADAYVRELRSVCLSYLDLP